LSQQIENKNRVVHAAVDMWSRTWHQYYW